MKKILLLILLLTVLVACEPKPNNNTIISSVSSPNDEFIAYVFIRDMGATTKKSYQLSILKVNKELNDSSGNTFISYGEFTIEWVDGNTLVVDNSDENIFKQKTNVNGVTVIYKYVNK